MSLASSSCTSLCSSRVSPTTTSTLTKQYPSFCTLLNTKNQLFLPTSLIFSNAHVTKHSNFIVKASETEGKTEVEKKEGEAEDKYEEYEVVLVQPYGLKFTKGRDGGTYIDAIAPGGAADKTGLFTVGDKVLATSAVFGDEIWPAAEYGRTMYTIRQRIGPLLIKMQKRYGKVPDMGDLTEKEIIRAERNSGVISNRVREIQLANAIKKKEQKVRREKDLREGLQLYKSGKYDEALEKFESVMGSRPEYNEAAVASYNVACCYSKLNQSWRLLLVSSPEPKWPRCSIGRMNSQ